MALYCHHCQNELSGKFCSNCAQPAKLKRIDAKYITHEIEHVLHLDTGIFYTVQALLLRPGKSVQEYLNTNRKKLVKPILFLIITSLLYSLVNHFFHFEKQFIEYGDLQHTTTGKILQWVQGHYGYSNLFMGVFIAFFLRWFFKKTSYNFFEVLVLLSYVMGFAMLIFALLAIIQGITHVDLLFTGGVLILLYTMFAIADFYDRKKIKNYFKALAAYFLGVIAFYSLLLIIGTTVDSVIK